MIMTMLMIIFNTIMIMTRYSTCTPKLTQNRFVELEEKPELLDDWDQRLVVRPSYNHNAFLRFAAFLDSDDDAQVSCLARGSDGRNLTVTQLAEKDQVIIIIIIITLQQTAH